MKRRSQPGPRVIKRYENRKLYDPTDRRYVTLAELARLVAQGHDVRVLDQRSGEDLTGATLVLVLLESVRQGASRIPRQVLTRLIRIAAGPPGARSDWPTPEDAALRARRETERLVARALGRGRLGLDDAVALRHELSELVQRLVGDAQAGVERHLSGLFARGEAAAERSLGALRGRLAAYAEPPRPKRRPRPPRRAKRARPRPTRKT